MADKIRLFKLSHWAVYRADSEDDARRQLQEDIEDSINDNFDIADAENWECEELDRDEKTEYLFNAFDDAGER